MQTKQVTKVGQVRPGVDPNGAPDVTSRTETYTLFTQIGGNRLLYSAESWVRVNLRLETAGPVAVSTREVVTPTLSGKGILLGADEVEFILPKGSRLIYTADSVNRVRFIIEPVPWLEQLYRTVDVGFSRLIAGLSPLQVLGSIASRARGGAPVAKPQEPEIPCPPPLRRWRGRR